MIDHYYAIITREVDQTATRKLTFAAKLSELCVLADGLRIDSQYPNKECFGNTRIEAMVSASDALRVWLSAESTKRNPAGSRVAS